MLCQVHIILYSKIYILGFVLLASLVHCGKFESHVFTVTGHTDGGVIDLSHINAMFLLNRLNSSYNYDCSVFVILCNIDNLFFTILVSGKVRDTDVKLINSVRLHVKSVCFMNCLCKLFYTIIIFCVKKIWVAMAISNNNIFLIIAEFNIFSSHNTK